LQSESKAYCCAKKLINWNMNYYPHEHTQHIIRIIPEEDAIVENYKRIAKVLKCFNDIHYNSYMLIHDGIMDDSIFLGVVKGEETRGCGAVYWEGLARTNEISHLVPDLTICFYAVEEWEHGKSQKEIYKDRHRVDFDDCASTSIFYDMYGIVRDDTTCCSSDDSSYELPDPFKIPRYKKISRW
jgi:hypothetical protein